MIQTRDFLYILLGILKFICTTEHNERQFVNVFNGDEMNIFLKHGAKLGIKFEQSNKVRQTDLKKKC